MAPVLAYWNIRGLAEPIRLLLHQAGVEFEDKRYEYGPPTDYYDTEWKKEKFNLGLKFPNIPYYIDGDLKLTQSVVILRHLARKHGFYPSSEKDEIMAETLEQLSQDIFQAIIRVIFKSEMITKDGSDGGEYFKKRSNEPLTQLSKFLEGKEWLVGGKLSYVDFLMYEVLSQHSYLYTDTLVRYPIIAQYLKRFESLPNIQKYMKEGAFREWPLYGPIFSWGGSGECPKRDGL